MCKKRISKIIILVVFGIFVALDSAQANNVAVTNVVLQNINTSARTVEIKFDLSQNNAFGDLTWDGQAFSDYIWITVKYGTDAFDLPTFGYKHAILALGGTITPLSDNLGAFIKSSTATTNMTVVWNYGANGVLDNASIKIKVLALEVVKIPTGKFTYGGSNASSNNYAGGVRTDVTSATSLPSGAVANWPNGYDSFYVAKYEVSQGQYADFLNMLSNADASSFFSGQSTDGHSITYTAGNTYGSRYSASAPNRGNNYMSTADSWSYSSWLAMRPITEMEFEKAGRGTNIGSVNTNTFPWGNSSPTGSGTYTYNDGSGDATYKKYFANYSSGRPQDVGHYLRGDVIRTNSQTGASPYGVTDLAGNNWEWVINCAGTALPLNGIGTLTIPDSWPVVTSVTKGMRGGSCYDELAPIKLSDRYYISFPTTGRGPNIGFRPVRTN